MIDRLTRQLDDAEARHTTIQGIADGYFQELGRQLLPYAADTVTLSGLRGAQPAVSGNSSDNKTRSCVVVIFSVRWILTSLWLQRLEWTFLD